MSTVIGRGLVLSELSTLDNNAGVIGYLNLANVDTISATSETLENPITNIVNPATAFRWQASSASTQTITIDISGQEVDYIGIARHNLNQLGLTITIKLDGVVVNLQQTISDSQAIMVVRNIAAPNVMEIVIEGATVAPSIAVLYVGKAIRLERNIYVGHTPITYGRNRTTVNGVSENGQYLGEIVVRETNSTSVSLSNLTPDWYRNTLDPFFKLSPRVPCFWAWRPTTYEAEVGFCWVEGEPKMSNQLSNGMVQADWNFKGLV